MKVEQDEWKQHKDSSITHAHTSTHTHTRTQAHTHTRGQGKTKPNQAKPIITDQWQASKVNANQSYVKQINY